MKTWYTNLANRNALTADTYLRRLGMLHREHGIDPRTLPAKGVEEIEAIVIAWVNKMKEEEYLPGYIESVVKAVRSWLESRRIQLMNLNLPVVEESAKYRDEVVPIKEEIRKILNAEDIRSKVAVSLIAFGGQRIQVLGSYRGKDGLELGDLPELKYDNAKKKAKFEKTPSYFRVRTVVSKKKHEYVAFIPEQACNYIVQYLEQRMREGEVLKPTSALLTSVWGRMKEVKHDEWELNPERAGAHINTTKVSRLIKIAMDAAGVDKRPYVLRRLYETQMLLNAPFEGLISGDFTYFFAGYKGPISHRYILHKGLAAAEIESMRKQYKKASDQFLVTERRIGPTRDESKASFYEEMLKMSGFGEQELEKLGDLSLLNPEKFRDLTRKKSLESLGVGENKQKIIPLSQLEEYVEKRGWAYIRDVPGGKAIVGLPGPSGGQSSSLASSS